MANNYTPAYRQYTQQSAGYALPSSVRTYSVFDPASNTWRRMTNDGMFPMPQGNQPDIQAALAQARQTQGTVYPAQEMGQGQPVEMHPGYLNPPVQGTNIPPRQATRPLARNNTRINKGPKISDYSNDDAILRVADIPPEVTLDAQPVAVNASVNMSPDHRTPTPYVSNETVGLAGYNPNITKTQTQLALGNHYRQSIPVRPLTFAEHWSRLFGGSRTQEATDALRAATGLPPLR